MTTPIADATRERILDALREVYDPELGVSVVDLGLVYGIDVDEQGAATITMTLTTQGCPMHESLGAGVASAVGNVPGVTGGEVCIVFDPPWEPSRMTDEGRRLLGYW